MYIVAKDKVFDLPNMTSIKSVKQTKIIEYFEYLDVKFK